MSTSVTVSTNDIQHLVRNGYQLQEWQLKPLLGLPKKLPIEYVPAQWIGDTQVFVLHQADAKARNPGIRRPHRVLAICSCGQHVPAGRLHQHRRGAKHQETYIRTHPVNGGHDKGAVITGEWNIRLAQMAAQAGALSLEVKGLRMSRGRSMYAIIKQNYGFKGTKQSVLDQFNYWRHHYAGLTGHALALVKEMEADNGVDFCVDIPQAELLTIGVRKAEASGKMDWDHFEEIVTGDQDTVREQYGKIPGYKEIDKALGDIFEPPTPPYQYLCQVHERR